MIGWTLLLLSSFASVPQAASPTDYKKDVAFLLDEFEKQAGTLLHQKQIDWKAVRAEFTKLAADVKDDAAHVKLCGRLVARLKDGHAGFTEVNASVPPPPPRYGVGLCLCESQKHVLVKQVFGPAAASGVMAGDEVLAIDGKNAGAWIDDKTREIADEHGFSTEHAARYAACHWGLVGESGQTIKLDLDRQKGGKKSVTLTFAKEGGDGRYVGPIFPAKDLVKIGRRDAYRKLDGGTGYIYLGECAGELGDELDTAIAALGDVTGLVLDLRANNGGGTDHADVFGRFLAPGSTWRQYKSTGKANFVGPMVVIVDEGTRSTGETVAGQFKEDGRAYMIGPSATAGMSAGKAEITVPSKLFKVRFAVSSNKQRFNGGKGIEGIGVAPNELVPWDAKQMSEGADPMIVRAQELLKKGLPKGAVQYVPPKAVKK